MDSWNLQWGQTSIHEIEIERPAEIDEDLADDRQTSEYQKESPHREILPNENLEKRRRLDECYLEPEGNPT